MARSGSLSQVCTGSPRDCRAAFARPKLGWYIQIQMALTATDEVMTGVK